MADTLKTRNSELSESFARYCREHPEQRFWQALLNWAELPFLLASSAPAHVNATKLVDTFYWEGKNQF